MPIIPSKIINFGIPNCSALEATVGLCGFLRNELTNLNNTKSKLQSLSASSVLGAIKDIASEEIGSEVVNAVSSVMTGYTSEFVSQVGSKYITEAQKISMGVLGFVGLILNGKQELLLAICQILVDDLDEVLQQFSSKCVDTVNIGLELDELFNEINDLETYYPKIKEKLEKAEDYLSRAQRQMTYLYEDMNFARKSTNDMHYSLAQSYLYIAKNYMCPGGSDRYEDIGRKAFNIASEYGYDNFGDILSNIWKEGGDIVIKNAFGNLITISNKIQTLYESINSLSDYVDRINFLKNSIKNLQLGALLSEGLFGDKLGLNKLVSKYLADLITKLHSMRNEITVIINKDIIAKTELMTNQLRWCDTTKLIIDSVENCITKRFIETGTANIEILNGYNDYAYMVYPHKPQDNIPSLTETSDFSLSTSLRNAIFLKTGVLGLATRGPSYVSSMKQKLNDVIDELQQYKNKSYLMRQDILGFNGYGNDIIQRFAELLNNVGLDRAADLLLSGQLGDFAKLTYLTSSYLGSSIDCLKKIYSGLKTNQEKIFVTTMLRKLYVENRTLALSNLNVERAIQEYNTEIDVKIADKEEQVTQFCY